MSIADEIKKARELHPPTLRAAGTPAGFPKETCLALYEETADDLADAAVSLLKDRMPKGLSTSTLRSLAPLGLMVTAYSGRSLTVSFSHTVPKPYMHAALKRAGTEIKVYNPLGVDEGDYIFDVPDSIIPDFNDLRKLDGISMGVADASYCRPEAVNPMILAYACSPHSRPLVAAAIKELIRDGKLEMPTTEMSKRRALDMIAQFAPDGFEYIFNVARRHDVDMHFALEDAQRSNGRFIDYWTM
ncbi:MAG: hypothetical protein HY051_05365 [Candidatus Aenigmarchaeota archaeon]|nr:hypothetical protein [Candidatus Aenigmarchaeota archaeon]